MFRPLSWYIGLRYSRSRRRAGFVSFISLASMLGIALGITVLITVLSVMNGFDHEIHDRIFSMAPQVTVTAREGGMSDWQQLRRQLHHLPAVMSEMPYVSGQALLSHGGEVFPVLLRGISPKDARPVLAFSRQLLEGKITALHPRKFGIVLGETLADRLGVGLGERVTVITAQPSVTPFSVTPRFKRFKVVGIFHAGGGFGLDQGLGLVNLQDAQVLYHMGHHITGLQLKINGVYGAPRLSRQLRKMLPVSYNVSDWTQDYGSYFETLQMEKTMMFVILVLIIAVAAFNLVATLVMVVRDKRPEIAILKTLGASPAMIMMTFIVQGAVIGVSGTLLGLLGGVALATHVSRIVSAVERFFHVQFISADFYFINFLPSRLQWHDVWQVCVVALALSVLATLYPAWKASHTHPAEALRYE